MHLVQRRLQLLLMRCCEWVNLSSHTNAVSSHLSLPPPHCTTVEPLYREHHWDPAGCPVYSGTSLQRTPLGPSWLSCIQWNFSIENTIGTQLAVLYTVEPLYREHHWDPAGCPVYSGTSLQRTPLGPSWLSCIQWNLSTENTIGTQLAVLYTVGPSWLSCIQWNFSIEDTIGTQLAVLYTVEPLYRGHHWDPAGCPVYSRTSL